VYRFMCKCIVSIKHFNFLRVNVIRQKLRVWDYSYITPFTRNKNIFSHQEISTVNLFQNSYQVDQKNKNKKKQLQQEGWGEVTLGGWGPWWLQSWWFILIIVSLVDF
jgi:hypothetical protein